MAGEPEEIAVGEDEGDQRLDQFLAARIDDVSRAQIQEWIKQGVVKVNQQVAKASTKVRDGDRLQLTRPDPEPLDLKPHAMPLKILFEDEAIIVVNKPAGISVHPGAGAREPTLVEGVLAHCHALAGGEEGVRPGVVHRLDKDTTGALVFAKTRAAHADLAEQFHDKTNERLYVVLLQGAKAFTEEATHQVSSYLVRDPKDRMRFTWSHEEGSGKHAVSHFEAREIFADDLVLATVRLETGRTHQIRIHALQLGSPVVGDSVYGVQRIGKIPMFGGEITRQMLHAWQLGFVHPTTGDPCRFEAGLPSDFKDLVEKLRKIKSSSEA